MGIVVSQNKPDTNEVWLHNGRVEWFSNGTWINTDASLEKYKEEVDSTNKTINATIEALTSEIKKLQKKVSALEKENNG